MATPGRNDLTFPEPKKSPLVKPGQYTGATTAVNSYKFMGARDFLVLSWDLFPSAEHAGLGLEPVARGVPYFLNLDSIGPRSKYARLVAILFPDRLPGERIAASAFVGHLAEVEVETVVKDGEQAPLPVGLHYSKVVRVLARA